MLCGEHDHSLKKHALCEMIRTRILSIFSSGHPVIRSSIYSSIHLSIRASIYSCIYLPVHSNIHPSIHPSIHPVHDEGPPDRTVRRQEATRVIRAILALAGPVLYLVHYQVVRTSRTKVSTTGQSSIAVLLVGSYKMTCNWLFVSSTL